MSLLRSLSIGIFLFPFLLCHAAPTVRVPECKINGRQSFHFVRLMQYNGAKTRLLGRNFEFASRFFSGEVRKDDRRSTINGVRVMLNFPVAFINGIPYITGFDWHKTFRPLLFPSTLKKHTVYTITIDMGHGGNDPGALGAFSKEKNITLKIGRRLGQILQSYGFKVRFVRNSDIKVPLEKIPLIQRRHRSDLFVSLHINSAKDRSVSGIETYCLTPAYAPSSSSTKIQRTQKPGNNFDGNNLALAYNIQRGMLKRTGAVDRGIKRANFVILRELNAPGVLIEAGFISHRIEERRLNNSVYIDALARGIADGIINYRRSIK